MESLNMFAGQTAGGQSGAELIYLAPLGTPLPSKTDPFAALDLAFQSPGLITQDGFSVSQDVSSEEIYSFGLQIQTRTLKTKMKQTGSFTMQETNPLSLAVYNGLPIGSITPDAQGNFFVERGKIRTQEYVAVVDARDGDKRLRWVMPRIEISPSGDLKLSMGAILERACEVAAYPDADGNAVIEYYGFPHLAGGAATPVTTP